MKDYGYKVCYKKQNRDKLKIYIITSTYDLAYYHVRWYENHSPPDKTLSGVTWIIVPIKSYAEYKHLWRNVPF
ncbi:MAG: hypothetical protein NC131_16580 [Roseburia sp.]|nr:hypothetical protein [Roseburia sp.]